jgi:sarcosine oxidase
VRAAVVGSGIVGGCAAGELASAGVDVTVFEQYDVGHDRASSFGDSRIIRRFYDDAYYTKLMTAAYPLWSQLEASSGQHLIERVGGLYFAPRDHPRLHSAQAGMRAAGSQPSLLDARALRDRFPAFRFDDDEMGFVDTEAGSLRASRCVHAAATVAHAAGAAFLTGTKVERIRRGIDPLDPAHPQVELQTAGGGAALFDRVFICAGPWTGRLLPGLALPLRATRQQYVYLRPKADQAMFAPGAMPIWIDAAANWYGFPEHGDIDGVKIASHDFGDTIDPDTADRTVDETSIARTRAYARRRLPAIADGLVTYASVCPYTVTPDEDFILDAVAELPGCFIFGGCSGHAFKFGTLLGALACDLVLEREPRVDISRFRLARFGL